MLLNENKFELLQFNPDPNNKNLTTLRNLPFSQTFNQYELPNNTQIEPSDYVEDLG